MVLTVLRYSSSWLKVKIDFKVQSRVLIGLILLLHLNVNARIFYLRNTWLRITSLNYVMCKYVYLCYILNMNL